MGVYQSQLTVTIIAFSTIMLKVHIYLLSIKCTIENENDDSRYKNFSRLTIIFFIFSRLTVIFSGVSRLTLNPIETLLKLDMHQLPRYTCMSAVGLRL